MAGPAAGDVADAEIGCDVLVIGAGAAGLIAALRAHEAGAHVLVIERDAIPRGSTAMSAGYLSGNGLLAAVGYGFLAGRAAARLGAGGPGLA